MPTPHKNKTFATFLALAFGAIGAHRFYLRGPLDRLGLLHLCCIPLAGMVYGAGHAPNIFWVLLPVLVSAIVGYVEALVIGVTPDEKWDARHNGASGRSSQTSWVVALLLVLTMLIGATILIATIARLSDLVNTGGAYG
jgi:TM2 domain-containing membrane protein YozV